ncbi:MAG: UDP-N-acetylmuramoyl-tripeptide--D-alanyl-D-alanine ligase [Lactococcus sp.]
MKLTIKEIAQVVQAKNDWLSYKDQEIHAIEFDSRLITSGDLFLPLKGVRDGHDFIETAFANGAVLTFSEKKIEQAHLLVDDNLRAFQALAKYYVSKMKPTVIAVTGSNGKTTTKDMIAAVLSEKYQTYKTQGNHNNEIGMPYTILHMPDDTEKLVLEMGMDHPGDIDLLSSLASPDLAVITLIGEAHLEFMGSRRNIAKGKMGIQAGLGIENELIAPADPIINEFIYDNQKITRFGADEDIYVTQLVEHRDYLTFNSNFMNETISIPVPGRYNATNAMLASYVGLKMGLTEKEIKHGLEHVELTRNRTEWKKAANGADILADVYNANPTATRLILETFQAIAPNENGRKLAVLADMLELGETAPQLHASIFETLDLDILDKVYLYGPMMKYLYDKAAGNPKVVHFDNLEQLTEAINTDLQPNDQILFKGSNGMKLFQTIEHIEKEI